VGHRHDQPFGPAEVQHQHHEPAEQQSDGQQARQRGQRLVELLAEHRADRRDVERTDAATIRNTANTCGVPQTTWLVIPVSSGRCAPCRARRAADACDRRQEGEQAPVPRLLMPHSLNCVFFID